MSDTPRTDGELARWADDATFVRPEFARKLERELNAANAYIARLIAAGNHATEYTSEHRQRIWRDAVNSKEDAK